MLINSAFAATETSTGSGAPATATPSGALTTGTGTAPTHPVGQPSAGEALMTNIGMVVVFVALFYLLMVRPQQKRFKEHTALINKLGKGDKIVTQGGLVGVIEKPVSDHEVLVDFGNGTRMTVLRSSIIGRYEDSVPARAPANDTSKAA